MQTTQYIWKMQETKMQRKYNWQEFEKNNNQLLIAINVHGKHWVLHVINNIAKS